MNKEKLTKEIVIMIQPSLYKKFKQRCNDNYITASEAIRQFIKDYIKKEDE